MSTIQVIGLFKTEPTGKFFSKLLVNSNIQVLHVTYTLAEFRESFEKYGPLIVVMDITWPQEKLFREMAAWLKKTAPATRLIGLSSTFKKEYTLLLQSVGAWGYIWLLHETIDDPVKRIRLVHGNTKVLEFVTPEDPQER